MSHSIARATPRRLRAASPRGALRTALVALALAALTSGCSTGVGGLDHRRPPAEIIVASTDLGAAIRRLARYLSDEDIAQALVDSSRPASEVSQGLRTAGLPADRLCRVATEYVRRTPDARRAEVQAAVGVQASAACAESRLQAPAAAAPSASAVTPPAVVPGPAGVMAPSVAPPYRGDRRYGNHRPRETGKGAGKKARGTSTRAHKVAQESPRRRGAHAAPAYSRGDGGTIAGDASSTTGAGGRAASPTTGAAPTASAAAAPLAPDSAAAFAGAGLRDSDIQWNLPGQLTAGRAIAVELRIKQTVARAKGADGAPTGPSAFKATLEASGVDVDRDAQRQALVDGDDVVWKWVISAREAGAKSLELNIAPISGDPAMGKIIVKTVDVAAAPTSMADTVERFLTEHREKLLIASIALLALSAIIVWSARRATRRKRIGPMGRK